MHAPITAPQDGVLMGADMPPQFGGNPPSDVSVVVTRTLTPCAADFR